MVYLYNLLGKAKCTLIYGAGGVGKTTLALEAALVNSMKNKTAIYAFSGPYSFINRALEICRALGEDKMPATLTLAKTDSFKSLMDLTELILLKPPSIVVVDTVTYAYRTAISMGMRPMEAGRMLSQILGLLTSAKLENGLLLVADAQTKPDGIEHAVGESPLNYWCDEVVCIKRSPNGERVATINNDKEVKFSISSTGTEEALA